MYMKHSFICLCLGTLGMMSPALADFGTVRGTTREQTVAKPQSVANFARNWGLAAEQIAWANGLGPAAELEQGREVKLPARILPSEPPKDGAVVNLAERGMYVFKDSKYRGFYPLAIGRGDEKSFRTPVGTYKIDDRVKNPDWIAPKSKWAKAMKKEKISGKDAKNPLGEYWFGIDHREEGYGFHQNMDPQSTGDKVSHGCMRLYPEHAKKIFNDGLLQIGDTVRIENRPVVLGKDKDGGIYVSTFPSAYGKTDLKGSLTKELKKEGLLGVVPSQTLEKLAVESSGVPQPLLSKPVALFVDGKAVKDVKAGLRREGSLIVPVSLARELGCKVVYKAKSGEILISKDGKSKAFTLDQEAEGNKAYRWGDQTMVSARSLLKGLDIPFVWNGKDERLEING